jgi:hypothetical protein
MKPCTRELSENKSSLERQILHMVRTHIHTHKKKNFLIQSALHKVVVFLTSAIIMGVQMGEMSKLGSLTGLSTRDMWADFGSIYKTLTSF